MFYYIFAAICFTDSIIRTTIAAAKNISLEKENNDEGIDRNHLHQKQYRVYRENERIRSRHHFHKVKVVDMTSDRKTEPQKSQNRERTNNIRPAS